MNELPIIQKRRKYTFWQPLGSYLANDSRTSPTSSQGKNRHLLANTSALHSFLQSNEWQHLHLSSMFVPQYHDIAKQQQYVSNLQHRKTFVYSDAEPPDMEGGAEKQIQAMLSWTEHRSLLFDCQSLRQVNLDTQFGSESLPVDPNEILPYLPTRELEDLLQYNKSQQFIGTQRSYNFLQSYYDFQFEICEYWMMVRKPDSLPLSGPSMRNCGFKQHSVVAPKPISSLPAGLKLERLGLEHFNQLLSLEQAYYAEEVIRADIHPSLQQALEKHCARRLKQFLQYGIFEGEALIARVMINAYGLYYWQIGGLYTTPRWRSQGMAHFLLQKLCHAIEQAGRLAMLFVRLENHTALGLYSKNSFEALDRMIIAQNSIH